ncbi:MAG: T9SS type A sorting domain-containing protein [Fibrobacteres bacterium]|nr:T9SS type A sorting domain-containing protein [Fibrobacterota bacterium]
MRHFKYFTAICLLLFITGFASSNSSDTTAPSNLLTLKATALSSRSIELSWADPSNSLPGIDAAENGNISLYYGIKTSPTAPYVWKKKYSASEFDSVRLSSALNAKKFVLKGDIDSISSNRTYYVAIAPADSLGNVNGIPLIARDSAVLRVPAPIKSGVVLQALNDTAFSVSYTGLRIPFNSPDTDFVNYVVFIVSDSVAAPSNLFEDPIKRQDLLNGFYDVSSRTGRTFLVKQRELAYTSSYIFGQTQTITLNKKLYISASYLSGSEVSPPVFIDSISYRPDKPFFKNYSARQINDSIVRLTFRPYDTTDVKIGVQIKYAINPQSASSPYFNFVPSQQFSSASFGAASGGQMVLDRDSSYTINLRLGTTRYQTSNAAASYFNGNDTNTLSIKFLISDLHGPIPSNSNDDSVVVPVIVDTKAPSPKNGSASVVFSDVPASKKLTIFLTAKAGAVDYVRYKTSDTAHVWMDSVSMKDVTSDTIVLEQTDLCYLSLRDSLGNKYDTAWSFSGSPREPDFIKRESRTITYDNGKLEINVSVNSIKDNVTTAFDTLKLYVGKRAFTQAELDALQNSGYAAVPYFAYFFSARHGTLNTADIWQDGLSLSAAIDSTVPDSLYDGLRVYRYNPSTKTAAFENSKIDYFGRLNVSGMKPPISDTLFYFIATDTQKVKIDSISLTFDKSERKLRLIARGSDNSKALSGGVVILGHTVTGTTKEYIRYNVNAVPGVAIDTSIIIPASDTVFDDLLRRGLFGAAWVTDRETALLYRDRRAYSFVRCEYKADSMKLTFRNLFEGYQLVSLPVSLSEEYDDVLLALQDYSRGVYDRNKFRLYRLDNDDSIKEFVATGYNDKGIQVDPDFRFGTGRAFFMRTRSQYDNNVPVKIPNPISVPINSNRGYYIASRATSGWVICSVPFLGTVSINDFQNTSSLRSTGSSLGNNKTVVPFGDRVYELSSSGWRPMQQRSLSSGTGDAPASFAAYLYAGESLFVPVIPNNDEFISLGWRIAKSSTEASDWNASALLYNNNLLKASAVVALSAYGNAELQELPIIDEASSRITVVSQGNRLSYEQRSLGGTGEIWQLEVTNGIEDTMEYEVRFDNIAKNLPEGWQVWVNDSLNGSSVDVLKSGMYGIVVPPKSSRVFNLVTGSPAFISKAYYETCKSKDFELSQNYPNPFNPNTTINFTVANNGLVSLALYSLDGRMVKQLHYGWTKSGNYKVVLNTEKLSSGRYIYRIKQGNAVITKMMTIEK